MELHFQQQSTRPVSGSVSHIEVTQSASSLCSIPPTYLKADKADIYKALASLGLALDLLSDSRKLSYSSL